MLVNTFCHIPGIGARTEQKIWDAGIYTWERYMAAADENVPNGGKRRARDVLEQSIRSLEKGDPMFFADLLPANQHWRMYPEFRNRTAFLDIETTGLGWDAEIVTICLYDGSSMRYYVQGENLRSFRDDIEHYDLLVTYNGKSFDIPCIESYFACRLHKAQIDLRYTLASLGIRGGLKLCERQLGIGRDDLADVDGFFAVLLWREYVSTGNTRALETLLAYNMADTLNLRILMAKAYNLKLNATPFYKGNALSLPDIPASPFQPDRDVIEDLQHRYGMDRWR